MPSTITPKSTLTGIANSLARVHREHVEQTFRAAVLKANGGVMPSDDELNKRGRIVVSPDNRIHLLWDCPPLGLGETADMTKCIASVAPPQIFKPTM